VRRKERQDVVCEDSGPDDGEQQHDADLGDPASSCGGGWVSNFWVMMPSHDGTGGEKKTVAHTEPQVANHGCVGFLQSIAGSAKKRLRLGRDVVFSSRSCRGHFVNVCRFNGSSSAWACWEIWFLGKLELQQQVQEMDKMEKGLTDATRATVLADSARGQQRESFEGCLGFWSSHGVNR
jgi:hypothetical protein